MVFGKDRKYIFYVNSWPQHQVFRLFKSSALYGLPELMIPILMLQTSPFDDQLLGILDLAPSDNSIKVSPSAIKNLLSEQYEESCWCAFTKAFPSSVAVDGAGL